MKSRLLLLVLLIVGLWGLKDIGIASDYRVFFGKDTADMQDFTQMENSFGSSDSAIFVISSVSGTLLNESNISLLREIHLHLLETPNLVSVTSILSNHPYLESNNFSTGLLGQLKNANQSPPSLLNLSLTSTGVEVRIVMPKHNPNAVIESATFIKETAAIFSKRTASLRFDTSGIVMMNDAFAYHLIDDLIKLVPASNIILFLITAWLFQSFFVAGIVIFVAGVSNIISLGMATLVGIQLTPPSGMSLIVILTISIACSFHAFLAIEQQKGPWHQRLKLGSALTAKPILFGCLTTLIGFLSLNLTDTPPYQDLGNITAFGVATVLLIHFVLLPWILAYKPIKFESRLKFNWVAYLKWIDKFRIAILLISLILITISISLVSKLEVNDKFTDWFSSKTEFKHQANFVSENLTGIYSIDFILESKHELPNENSDFFVQMSNVASHFQTFDNVWEVRSIHSIINKEHDATQSYKKIKSNFEILHARGLIDQSGKLFKMSIVFKDADSTYIQSFNTQFQQYLIENTDSIAFHGGHGPSVLFANIVKRNIKSMMVGVIIMLITLSVLFSFYFKSLKLGAVALFTNALPILIAFAFWALLYQQVGLAVSIVAACSLGIIVDDTTHFLFHYQEHLNKKNTTKTQALAVSLNLAGQAIIFTSIALVSGFSVFMFSDFLLNTTFASLTIITFISALVFDLLILPAALLIHKRK
ncbi:hypothetical protein CXF85_06175 [Colwellia sp. 75C3]|nr:hypothetical protein CXF85_06175 [Colwellia sp. 75C3]